MNNINPFCLSFSTPIKIWNISQSKKGKQSSLPILLGIADRKKTLNICLWEWVCVKEWPLMVRKPSGPHAQRSAYFKITDCVWDTCVCECSALEREQVGACMCVCVCLCAYVGLFHSLKFQSGFYKHSLIMEKKMMHYFGELWPWTPFSYTQIHTHTHTHTITENTYVHKAQSTQATAEYKISP